MQQDFDKLLVNKRSYCHHSCPSSIHVTSTSRSWRHWSGQVVSSCETNAQSVRRWRCNRCDIIERHCSWGDDCLCLHLACGCLFTRRCVECNSSWVKRIRKWPSKASIIFTQYLLHYKHCLTQELLHSTHRLVKWYPHARCRHIQSSPHEQWRSTISHLLQRHLLTDCAFVSHTMTPLDRFKDVTMWHGCWRDMNGGKKRKNQIFWHIRSISWLESVLRTYFGYK